MSSLAGTLPPTLVARLAFLALAYLLGAIPFGLLVTRVVAGKDVRTVGSGNIGATNVARAAGKRAAVLTLLLDAAKGFAPAYLAAAWLLPVAQELFPELPAAEQLQRAAFWPAGAGLAAVVGHVFPVTLRFRGGKGVATAFGVCLALVPLVALAGAAVYAVLLLLFRVSSVGSLAAALTAVGAAWLLAPYHAYFFGVLAMVLLIFARHAGNLRRLLARSEAKV